MIDGAVGAQWMICGGEGESGVEMLMECLPKCTCTRNARVSQRRRRKTHRDQEIGDKRSGLFLSDHFSENKEDM